MDLKEILVRQEIQVLPDRPDRPDLEILDILDHLDQRVLVRLEIQVLPVQLDQLDHKELLEHPVVLKDQQVFKVSKVSKDLLVLQLIKADLYHLELQHLDMFHFLVILQVLQRLLLF